MNRKYYYSTGVDRVGPVTLSELKLLSELHPGTLIWYPGLPSWIEAEGLSELSELFMPPPLPVVPPPLPVIDSLLPPPLPLANAAEPPPSSSALPLEDEYVLPEFVERESPNFRIEAIRKLKAEGVLFDEYDIEVAIEDMRVAYVASESFRRATWELECAVVAENHRLRRESSLRYRSLVANHLSESPPSVEDLHSESPPLVANHLNESPPLVAHCLNESLPAAAVSQSSVSEVPAKEPLLDHELLYSTRRKHM